MPHDPIIPLPCDPLAPFEVFPIKIAEWTA
jgi:hypothetical protein